MKRKFYLIAAVAVAAAALAVAAPSARAAADKEAKPKADAKAAPAEVKEAGATAKESAKGAKEAAGKGDVGPIKAEMRALDKAYKAMIDALVLNDPKRLEGPYKEYVKAKEKSEKAIKAGTHLPPKAERDINTFREMDEKFHAKFDAMSKAALKGDIKSVYRGAGAILHQCVRCHARFR